MMAAWRLPEHDNLLEWTLFYARMGIQVFPLRPKSKLPLIPADEGGHGHLDATTSEDQIRYWWGLEPNANIGAAMGMESGFVVLDVDMYKPGVEDVYEDMVHQLGGLPETWTVLTGGGGMQQFFSVTEHQELRCRNGFLLGHDFKGDGGYVVLPPSIHPFGRRYEWEASLNPETMEPAPIPELLAIKFAPQEETKPEPQKDRPPVCPERLQDALDHIPASVADDRDLWIAVGMALKAELGEEGLPIWDRWSQLSTKYKTGEPAKKWESFKGTGVTAGTVFHLAIEHGWEPRESAEELMALWRGTPGHPLRCGEAEGLRELDGSVFEPVVEPLSCARLPDQPPPPREWLVSEIIPKEDCTLITGPPKGYKTFLELDVVFAITAGRPVLDRWRPNETGRVLMYCPEGGIDNLWRRVYSMCWAYDISPDVVRENLFVIEERVNVSDPDNYRRLKSTIQVLQPLLLTLDPLISCHRAKSENDSADMQPVLDLIRDLKKAKPDITILMVHHTPKGGESPRGSSAIDGWWDTIFKVAHDEETEISSLKVRHRDGKKPPKTSYRLVASEPRMVWARAGGYEELRLEECQEEEKKKEKDDIEKLGMEALEVIKERKPKSINELAIMMTWRKAKAKDVIDYLVVNKLINEKTKQKDPYTLTDEGEKRLRAHVEHRRRMNMED